MNVKGRDPASECYRVEVDVDGAWVHALVPERLAASLRLFGTRPSHQDAYVWMAEHKEKIEAAIAKLARGQGSPRAPYDQITLIEER